MMLEHGMQPDHRELLAAENLLHPAGLRQAVSNTAWTEHLEGMQRNHAPAQRFERDRPWRVEPAADLEGGSIGEFGHGRSA